MLRPVSTAKAPAPASRRPEPTKYVRVTGLRGGRFVEFDFSIGDPALFVELTLPKDQFDRFCARNQVRRLTPQQAAAVDADRRKWRQGEPSG